MKRVLTIFLAATFLSVGLAKATAQPALELHFAGVDNLIQREDAKTLKTIWMQKETREFRTETLGKLAKHLATQCGKSATPFKSILPDLGLGETALSVTPGDNSSSITLVAAMSKTRGNEWIKQLKKLTTQDGAKIEEKTQDGYTGWRVDFAGGRSIGSSDTPSANRIVVS